MFFKLETHVHTKYSHDSIMPFWLLYLKCRVLGINYIAITEHNNLIGANKFREYCRKRGNKINVIIGEEIMTTEGEIIGLFLKNEIVAGLPPDITIKRILEQKGIVYIPHPYDLKRWKTVLKEYVIEQNKNDIHCIEIHNGRNISTEYDEEQGKIAEKYQILPVIGSDAHTIFEIGRNYMISKTEPNNPQNFLIAIQEKKIVINKCLKYSHWLTKIDRVIKFVIRRDFNGLYRTINKKFRR